MAEVDDVIDEIAEMIADWFGRPMIDSDRDLADRIFTRVAKEYGFNFEPATG